MVLIVPLNVSIVPLGEKRPKTKPAVLEKGISYDRVFTLGIRLEKKVKKEGGDKTRQTKNE